MKILTLLFLVSLLSSSLYADTRKKKIRKPTQDRFQNRLIDYSEFQKIVVTSSEERETHRVTETEFLQMMSESDVIILDARSESRYRLRHVLGAKNLPFTEFTENSLKKVIPDKKTKILIYCNNNFEGSPEAFEAKAPAASLNLSTFTSLRAYGYQQIFELGPLLDVKSTKIPFEGKELETIESIPEAEK